MTSNTQDQWAQWLLHRRFGGDLQRGQAMLQGLAVWRDRLLERATVAEGKTVLDVGCGDGLIAFGALDCVGEEGVVIFSDISQDLLDHCHSLAEQMQALGGCGHDPLGLDLRAGETAGLARVFPPAPC